MSPSPWRRKLLRVTLVLAAAFLVFAVAIVLSAGSSFGGRPTGARLARMESSPQWKDGRFANPEPLWNDWLGMLTSLGEVSEHTSPEGAVPSLPIDPSTFATPAASGLRVTWFGHSSVLVEIDGRRVLLDPMWGERSSPVSWLGPRRWSPPAIPLSDLPEIDAVLISHDHYDHLDRGTIVALAPRGMTFVVPLGVGAHLERWGVPPSKIVELDWWEHWDVGGLAIHCTPARHASGRVVWDRDRTLWAGWAVVGPAHRAWYSGDTGLFPGIKEIGKRLGPFDVTMIDSGQYHRTWPDWHIGPEQAVLAHEWVGGRVMLPVHWAMLGLAYHGWTEPGERTVAEAARRGDQLWTPQLGESFEPSRGLGSGVWWPALPWQRSDEAPIRSTGVDARP